MKVGDSLEFPRIGGNQTEPSGESLAGNQLYSKSKLTGGLRSIGCGVLIAAAFDNTSESNSLVIPFSHSQSAATGSKIKAFPWRLTDNSTPSWT